MENEWTMPFGKFKGTPLKNVPDGYLKWLLEREWVEHPLRWRVEDTLQASAKTIASSTGDVLKKILGTVRSIDEQMKGLRGRE